ncbi:hypothetical protein BGL84_04900, partial [Helicobacter pylori]
FEPFFFKFLNPLFLELFVFKPFVFWGVFLNSPCFEPPLFFKLSFLNSLFFKFPLFFKPSFFEPFVLGGLLFLRGLF